MESVKRRVKTKDGKLVYKNFSEKGDVPYYATNEDKQNAVNDKKLHPDFLKDHNFYQEEKNEEEEKKEDVQDLTEEQKQKLAKTNKVIKKVVTNIKDYFVITPECVF